MARVTIASGIFIAVVIGIGAGGVVASRVATSKANEVQLLLVQRCHEGLVSLATALQRREDAGGTVQDGPLGDDARRALDPTATGAFVIDHTVDKRVRVRCAQQLDPVILRAYGGVPGGRHLAAMMTTVAAPEPGASPSFTVRFGALP